jgi:hypothetical protein
MLLTNLRNAIPHEFKISKTNNSINDIGKYYAKKHKKANNYKNCNSFQHLAHNGECPGAVFEQLGLLQSVAIKTNGHSVCIGWTILDGR